MTESESLGASPRTSEVPSVDPPSPDADASSQEQTATLPNKAAASVDEPALDDVPTGAEPSVATLGDAALGDAALGDADNGGISSDSGRTPDKGSGPLSELAWGQAARAFCLTVLIAMGILVFLAFAPGGEWVANFLRKNQLSMAARMKFIAQIFGGGLALGTGVLGYVLSRNDKSAAAARFEGWAWFCSPLMLLPALVVFTRHTIWAQNHDGMLPVVLFGAIIAELLFSKAFAHIPPEAEAFWARLFVDRGSSSQPEEPAPQKTFVQTHALLLIVVGMALAYGAFMSFYTVRWHNKLGTAIFDLGINNNLIYGGLEGKFNQSTVIFPDDPQKYVANHVKLGLYTFLPIYYFFPKPETMLIIQSVSLGLGAIPLFLFARSRLPESWALCLAAAYLAYYPMHGANFYEMKLVPTAASIVLTCIWAIDAGKFKLGMFAFFWALIIREDLPVPLAVVGMVFLLSGRRPKAGLFMASVASVWFVFLRFRYMNQAGSWWFPNMYEGLFSEPEKGFQSVIKTLVSNPTYTLKHIFVEKKFWYVMHLLVPLGFLPVRRWYGWAALVPGAIMTLLVTDYAPPTMFSFQYVMHWSPYLFTASVLVLQAISNEPGGKARARGALVAMALSSAALSFNYGAFPLRDRALESGYHKIDFGFSKAEAEQLAQVRALVKALPPSVSVASTERVGAHLSSRFGLYTLRRGSHGAQYIVANKAGLKLDRTKETVRDALVSGEYGLIKRYGEFYLFKRGASIAGNQAVIDEWQLKSGRGSARDLRKPKRRRGADDGTDQQPASDAAEAPLHE